jgi:DNA-binding SARP family transcriptional activator
MAWGRWSAGLVGEAAGEAGEAIATGGQAARSVTLNILGDLALVDRFSGENLLPRGRKARALVAFLALAGGRPVRRERLAALLWGDRAHDQARASLRQAIGELRELTAPGRPLLAIDREEISLNPDGVAIDRDDLIRLAKAGDLNGLEAALARWRGGVLTDLEGLGDPFDDWLSGARQITESAVLDAALTAAETALSPPTARLCATIATRLLAIDPFNERAARLGLRSAAEAGDTAEMHRRYRQFEARLRAELGAAPSESTRTLLVELGRPIAAPSADRVAPEDTPSAPDVGSPPGARSPDWKITALVLVPVLAGAIFFFATRLGRLETVVGRLAAVAPTAESRAIDPATLTVYLTARTALDTRSRLGVIQALSMLQQVVARAPTYSRGWSSLGFAELLAANSSYTIEDFKRPSAYWAAEARASARRALVLDPRNGEAYMTLAQLASGPDPEGSQMALISKGLAVDPHEASLWRMRGQIMLTEGYADQAVSDFRRAIDLDPSDSRTVSLLYSALALAGRVPEARRLLDDGLARFPLYPHLWREKFVALLAEHRYAEAEAMTAPTALKPDRSFIGPPAELALVARALKTGQRADAEAAIAPARADPSRPDLLVLRLALLGRVDEAYDVAKLASLHGANMENIEMYADTPFEPFRRDPRFLTLMADAPLLRQWRTSGHWPDFCQKPGWPYDCKAVAAR